MTPVRAFLWFNLAMSVFFGGLYLFDPSIMAEPMGVAATSPAGTNDLRATYGGFQLGVAAFLWWCLREPSRQAAGLVGLAAVIGGLGLCRAIGLVVDGFSGGMFGATVFELGWAAICLYLYGREAAPAGAAAA